MTPQRAAILREMGIAPLWRLRGRSDADATASVEARSPDRSLALESVPLAASLPLAHGSAAETFSQHMTPTPRTAPQRIADFVDAALPSREKESHDGSASREAGTERAGRIRTLGWDDLEADIRACRACGLCERRKQAVPGVGDRSARWMLVGEGPGAEEDQRGEPFVGQAGKLLDNMLASMGLKRGEGVFIANTVKCRPPHNRTPEAVEIAACLPYLQRQIALVQPRLLVALGRPAAQALLGTDISIGAARGKRFEHAGIPVVVSYHPAYLLRNPQDKGKAWEDLCFARRLVAPDQAL